MSGWNFATGAPNSYARATLNPITAYPFSVFVCARVTDLDTTADTLFSLCNPTGPQIHWSIRRSGGVAGDPGRQMMFRASNAGTSENIQATTLITEDLPFRVAVIASSATSRKIIVNGDLAGAATGSVSVTPASVSRMTFGRKDDDVAPGEPWEGDIFYAATWSGSLTDHQAVALCAGAWPPVVRGATLRNFWPRFEPVGGGISDWRARSHLSLTGGAVSTSRVRRFGPPVAYTARQIHGGRAVAKVI